MIKQCLTGCDNETYDIARVLWALGVVVGVGLSVISVLKGQPWDIQSYGIGFGTLLAGGGAAVRMKASSEPRAK